MLKHIPKNISPKLMKIMMEMGHGDEILLADANFPRNVYDAKGARVVRMDGTGIPELLKAILQVFPLDEQDPKPCTVCKTDEEDFCPDIWKQMAQVVADSEEGEKCQKGFDELERYSFYKRCTDVFCMVVTGETDKHGAVILKKGAVK